MDATIASILTAAIVGLVSIITTIIANRHSFQQQKAQWEKEERKAKIEIEQRDKDRDLELKKFLINQLQEIYGNSISNLSAMTVFDPNYSHDAKIEFAKHLEEAEKWLSLIAAFHYDKQSDEYDEFIGLYNKLMTGRFDEKRQLRTMVIKFASNDPRLKI